ncbi:Anaphase-promoting complex (APC), subunit 2 [Phaffia rhodozyma]|uniref:Anaphase-promoting complex (APC), subunit 2 n=1 Tax=Phaffia rhodozyma TaxID=264483 RepID=A0A0F7SUJ1_PHARH|nr:Anaphase-promoting complex (APC), subunit 2 [Phaffia rhodozyma]
MNVCPRDEIELAWDASFQSINPSAQPDIHGLVQISKAWDLAVGFLKPRNLEGLNWNDRGMWSHHSGILAAFRMLKQANLVEELLEHFYSNVERNFAMVEQDITRMIHSIEESNKTSTSIQTESTMFDLFERLVAWQKAWAAPVAAFENPALRQQFQSRFIFQLHLRLPASFPNYMHAYFLSTFNSYLSLVSSSSPDLSQSKGSPIKPSPHLHRLGLIVKFGSELMAVACEQIRRRVKEQCEGQWGERTLEEMRIWGREVVGGWWESLYEGVSLRSFILYDPARVFSFGTLSERVGEKAVKAVMKPIYSRLDHYVCKTMCELRTTELFDIIVNHPNTLPVLEDLRECLFRVDSRDALVKALHASNDKRLLHPGADTKDIISQYISTIRCLRIVDPPGVLLQKISSPIRSFLRKRPDTIRCIVASLVDDDEGLEMDDVEDDIKPLQVNDDLEEDYSNPNWVPEPIDAAPEFRSGKTSDIISTLVSIYDTQEDIVTELQALLAQKLLTVQDYDLEKEIRIVEILKLRFGESALRSCEVMLKDLADSKRIDQHVQSDIQSVIHPKIISRLFWPEFPRTKLQLPEKLGRSQTKYAKAYHRFKPDKRLKWIPQLGTIDVKLELADRIVEVEANPIQAAVIELFDGDGSAWSTSAIASKLSIPDQAVVLSTLNFWANLGVLGRDLRTESWLVIERVGAS